MKPECIERALDYLIDLKERPGVQIARLELRAGTPWPILTEVAAGGGETKYLLGQKGPVLIPDLACSLASSFAGRGEPGPEG